MLTNMMVTEISPPFEKPWGNYLLEHIVENQAPNSISWLPQTVGWQLLAIALIVFSLRQGYQAYKYYQHNAYRRHALTWLTQCQQSNDPNRYQQLPALLRKTALLAFSRTDISHLSGQDWEHWLDKQCRQSDFTQACPNLLHQLAYLPMNTMTFQADHYQILMAQITLWIKHHRSEYDKF